jgi:hypothetical protein
MNAAQETAEAISDGINWLTWLSRRPTQMELGEAQARLQPALAEMASALAAVLRGEVWSSQPVHEGLLQDLSAIQDEVQSNRLSEQAILSAEKILRSFGAEHRHAP